MAERAERPERGNRDMDRYPEIDSEIAKCKDFLANYKVGDDHPYSMQLQDIANRERKLLEIQLDDVLSYKQDEEFVNNIKRNSKRYIKLFESAAELNLPTASRPVRNEDVFDILVKQRRATLEQIAADNETATPREVDIPRYITRRFDVVLVPLSDDMKLPRKLREVKASDIGHLVTVKGMVTRANDVKPYIVGCTYICDTCGSEIYQEITGPSFMPTNTCPSQRCIDNKTPGRVNMLTRGSKFIKYQELRVQELPDQVPVGHIPRSITVQCKGEATRSCGPGDIVVISGIFLAAKAPHSGFRGGKVGLQSSTYLEACKVDQQKQNYADMASGLDSETQKIVTEISEDPDPYSRLSQSIAPEIFGHEDVKKALLLQLVGGVSRSLSDGMKIRGDINICLMGDPGVAKSQLLKFIAGAAPRGVYTTGKGSSGVGLTAAVIRDPVTGDLSLEGGALVLADMGICCIDEFDKMDDSDRTAIHEVMEQQTISIAKAGITTTLNARAAVLAAANPLYGRYNKRKSISENVDLPNSLLSRFDLMFLLLDKANMETDLALSRHVLHVHRYLKNPKSAFTPLSPAMVKQYISIARAITPVVPQELTAYIVEAYVSLRSKDVSGAGHGSGSKGNHTDQAVLTARQLLSILRLSQALARLRLSNTIGHEDVDEAMRLVHSSKSSLLDDGPAVQQEDVTSAIYSIMRDVAAQRGASSVDFNHIEMMIVKKGYSSQQLRNCINEYQSLGVLSTVDNGSTITFD